MRRIAIAVTAVMLGWALLPAPTHGAPVQTFDTSGVYEVDVAFCYGGSGVVPGPSGNAACAGDALTALPLDTAVSSAVVVTVPQGSRLVQEHLIFTPTGPGQWQRESAACGVLDGNGECTAGASTGSITMRVDLGCSNGPDDILTAGGPGGALASWPDASLWTPADLVRTAQGTTATSGANAYATSIVPWPTSAPTAFGFVSTDTTSFSSYAIGGGAPLTIPEPIDVQLSTYTSGYGAQSGLEVSTLLVGGSTRPPTDNTVNNTVAPDVGGCFDSPEHLVLSSNTLKTPSIDGLVVRWAVLTAAPDLRDGTATRILDWECRSVGLGAPDADGDCLADVDDANDGDADSDNDGLPDGVEAAAGSNPSVADTEVDGASDFEELVQFTDANDSDSDNDGQLDRPDVIPTNTCAELNNPTACDPYTPGILDAQQAFDDNCPAHANPSQANTDSNNDYHGKAGNTGDQAPGPPSTHFTNPSEDVWGDACDRDDDNDALADVAENPTATVLGGTTIGDWQAGPGTPATNGSSLCKGPGVAAAPAVPLRTDEGDSDNDLVLDGRECQFRSRPDSSARVVADCPNSIPVFPAAAVQGCGQPGNTYAACAGGQDGDSDGLCLQRSTGLHANLERVFRTHGINSGAGTQVNDTDGCGSAGSSDIDADNDTLGTTCSQFPEPGTQFAGLTDGDEVLFYNTSATRADSDGDGCPDNEEVLDLNGSGNVNAGDQLLMASRVGLNPAPAGTIVIPASVNGDVNKDGILASADQLAISRPLGIPGNCTPNPSNGFGAEGVVVVGSSTKP